MRQFYTVVLERMQVYSDTFATEPYEAGWASEAMFFIRIHEIEGKSVVIRPRVQVSVDGIEWIDEGTVFPDLDREGSYFTRVSHFGGWLRLVNLVEGNKPSVKATIQLVLKE